MAREADPVRKQNHSQLNDDIELKRDSISIPEAALVSPSHRVHQNRGDQENEKGRFRDCVARSEEHKLVGSRKEVERIFLGFYNKMMPQVEMNKNEQGGCQEEPCDLKAARDDLRNRDISCRSHEPCESQRMREKNDRCKCEGQQALEPLSPPNQRKPEKREAERNIVIEKTHLERPAIRDHRNQGNDQPWRAARGSADE